MNAILDKIAALVFRILLIAIVAPTFSGCIPVAWVTPPVELEASMGPMMRQSASLEDHKYSFAVPARATVFPMQLYPSLLTRNFDVGVGYGFTAKTPRPLMHGPHLELIWFQQISEPAFLGWLIDNQNRTRLGVHLKGHALFLAGRNGAGPGATLQVSINGFGFTDTDFDFCGDNQNQPIVAPDPTPYRDDDDEGRWPQSNQDKEAAFCGAGYAWGETSVGMYLETSYGRIDERDHWFVGLGFKVRVPASIGAGLVAADF